MKLSDYVIQYLQEYGIRDCFLLSGGGMMHLLDSLAASSINQYYNLNEQATTMCADGYAQCVQQLSFCMVTTGPGGTNAVTGVASAFQDSTPMIVISGQVKTADLAPKGVRAYGPQEVDIVSIVAPITKYAVTVKEPEEIRYHLEKAVHLATSGRKGPVWLDIPLNVQSATIEPKNLKGYSVQEIESTIEKSNIENVLDHMKKAKKPVVLLGHGVIGAGAQELAKEFVSKANIPVLCTWRARHLFNEDDTLYFGMPGALAQRYANFILQEADFLLIIGSTVKYALTAFDESNFAKNATKFIVDVDEHEINKLHIEFKETLHCDAKVFLEFMMPGVQPCTCEDWLSHCRDLKNKYNILHERPNFETNLVYGYDFAHELSLQSKETDVIVASPTGRACVAINMAFALKEGQLYVATAGLGSMGYALPLAIGACVASGKRRTLVFEGDGSLQHNLQELQLLITYGLPIKLFVYNNGGYASIYGMQTGHFKGRLAGCNAKSGVCLPDIQKLAQAYGLSYSMICNTGELSKGIQAVLLDDEPHICEVMGDIRFEEIPRTQTKINADGSIVSGSLTNLYPFLEENP